MKSVVSFRQSAIHMDNSQSIGQSWSQARDGQFPQ